MTSSSNSPVALTPRRAWVAFAAFYLFGVVSVIAHAKAAPLLTIIGDDFGMGLSTVGWINSCFSIAGIIVAFPAALLIRKLGFRGCIAVSGASLVAGAFLGLVAATTPVFLVARMIEGFALGLNTVLCPAAVVRLFEPAKRGLPMGLWATWMGAGAIVAYIGSPMLNAAFGWRSLWAASLVMGVAATVFLLLVSGPLRQDGAGDDGGPAAFSPRLEPHMKSVVLLSLVFFVWNFSLVGATCVFYPTYLQDAAGMSVQAAALVAIGPNVVSIVTAPIAGPLIARRMAYKPVTLAFYVLAAVAFCGTAFLAHPTIGSVGFTVVAMGVGAGVVPMATFSLIPIYAATPERNDLGMALLSIFQNSGMMIGSAAFGAAVAATSWPTAAHLLLIPINLVGLVLFALIADPKKLLAKGK